MTKDKTKTFEASLSELERIVRQLEDGDLTLEESLKLFENGVHLARECQERLNQAERRIEVLMKDQQGNPFLEDFSAAETDDMPRPKIKKRIVFEDDDDTPF